MLLEASPQAGCALLSRARLCPGLSSLAPAPSARARASVQLGRLALEQPRPVALLGLSSSSRPSRRRWSAPTCSAEGRGDGSSGGSGPSASGASGSSSNPEPGAEGPSPSGTGTGSGPPSTSSTAPAPAPRRPPAPRSGPFRSWLASLGGRLPVKEPLRLALNAAALLMLMRFWGPRLTPAPSGGTHLVEVPFSSFVRSVARDEVARVVVDGETVYYKLHPLLRAGKGRGRRAMPKPPAESATLQATRPAGYPMPYETLARNDVVFSGMEKATGRLATLLTYAFYACLLLLLLNRLPMGRMGHRGAGRRHAASSSASSTSALAAPGGVTFADVAGVDEAKEELAEVVDFLRTPERYARLGARPPSGVLLVGPPGTGKTLLAKAVAGEAGVPFFSISASEFVELYVGMGAARVRELFASARREAPSIVFIDEIDAVAKGRDSRMRSVGNDEREQTLNQLLTELDGFDSSAEKLVICVAATNRADVLDPALLRPGRFDRRVAVERPDRRGREDILRVHLAARGLPLAPDVAVPDLAAQTTGFTGADLANLVNEAALLAGRASRDQVTHADFDAAVLRAVAGVEKKRSMLGAAERAVVARHEAGHALVSTAVAALIPGTAPVEKLSIVPRAGGALGFTYAPSTAEDRALLFEPELRGQLAVLMGGRAAEALTCDSRSTGAVDDLRRATELAHRAVAEWGLSAAVGPLSVAALASAGGDDYSAVLKDGGSPTARLVESEVRLLCEAALAVASDAVAANRARHTELSGRLEAEEKLESAALAGLLAGTAAPDSLRAFVLRGEIDPEVRRRATQGLAGA